MSVAPDKAEYQRRVAAGIAAQYKAFVLTALEILPGDRIADIGCGPGVDLAAMSDRAGAEGQVYGIDFDEAMVAIAGESLRDRPNVSVVHAAAQALPFDDAMLDSARFDRSLQHMSDPLKVLTEIRRVLRPGGRLVVAEPDWPELRIEGGDKDVARQFVDHVCASIIRNASLGRDVAELARQVGFVVDEVATFTPTLDDFEAADYVVGLTRVSASAVRAGVMRANDRDEWLADLQSGPMWVGLSQVVTVLNASSTP